jgi:hypothetical protein
VTLQNDSAQDQAQGSGRGETASVLDSHRHNLNKLPRIFYMCLLKAPLTYENVVESRVESNFNLLQHDRWHVTKVSLKFHRAQLGHHSKDQNAHLDLHVSLSRYPLSPSQLYPLQVPEEDGALLFICPCSPEQCSYLRLGPVCILSLQKYAFSLRLNLKFHSSSITLFLAIDPLYVTRMTVPLNLTWTMFKMAKVGFCHGHV